ncbi:hypothetical protein Tco_0453838 [Tanacetum coccineum]
MAFVSSPSSTNEVNTTSVVSTANTQVSRASTQVRTANIQVSIANLNDGTVYAFVAKAIQADCDIKATNIILQGLPPEVYPLVSNHKVAKELWTRIQLLMQGTSLTK